MDDELKSELARLLPEYVITTRDWIESKPSEMLEICYLIRVKYELPILVGWNEPWQEQARHIIRYMAAHDAIMETKT